MLGDNKDGKGSFLGFNDDTNADFNNGDEAQNNSGIKPKGTVSINNVNPLTDPNETETVLEYILTTIAQSMGLNPKQAAGLLSNNNKYLVHVCVKGVKGDFEKISQWYQAIYSS